MDGCQTQRNYLADVGHNGSEGEELVVQPLPPPPLGNQVLGRKLLAAAAAAAAAAAEEEEEGGGGAPGSVAKGAAAHILLVLVDIHDSAGARGVVAGARRRIDGRE
jgi:hypothetical protein